MIRSDTALCCHIWRVSWHLLAVPRLARSTVSIWQNLLLEPVAWFTKLDANRPSSRQGFSQGLSLILVWQMLRFTFEECLFSIGALDFWNKVQQGNLRVLIANECQRKNISSQHMCCASAWWLATLPIVMKRCGKRSPGGTHLLKSWNQSSRRLCDMTLCCSLGAKFPSQNNFPQTLVKLKFCSDKERYHSFTLPCRPLVNLFVRGDR